MILSVDRKGIQEKENKKKTKSDIMGEGREKKTEKKKERVREYKKIEV